MTCSSGRSSSDMRDRIITTNPTPKRLRGEPCRRAQAHVERPSTRGLDPVGQDRTRARRIDNETYNGGASPPPYRSRTPITRGPPPRQAPTFVRRVIENLQKIERHTPLLRKLFRCLIGGVINTSTPLLHLAWGHTKPDTIIPHSTRLARFSTLWRCTRMSST